MNKVLVGVVFLSAVFAATAWGIVGGGDITFSPGNASAVIFSHDAHVTKHKQKCGGCHYKIFTTTAQRKDVTMAEMQKGRSCGVCHNGQQAFDVKAHCNSCHPS
jgi:c(7)-type cytochrome triheme protein